jgi:hypothetical protein
MVDEILFCAMWLNTRLASAEQYQYPFTLLATNSLKGMPVALRKDLTSQERHRLKICLRSNLWTLPA